LNVPTDIIVCIVTVLGGGIMALLTLVVHVGIAVSNKLTAIGATLAVIDKRNALEDEKHSTLATHVVDIQARLDRQGVLA